MKYSQNSLVQSSHFILPLNGHTHASLIFWEVTYMDFIYIQQVPMLHKINLSFCHRLPFFNTIKHSKLYASKMTWHFLNTVHASVLSTRPQAVLLSNIHPSPCSPGKVSAHPSKPGRDRGQASLRGALWHAHYFELTDHQGPKDSGGCSDSPHPDCIKMI